MSSAARLLVVATGGWRAIRWGCGLVLVLVFMAQGAALVVYGVLISAAIAASAWFERDGWPFRASVLLR